MDTLYNFALDFLIRFYIIFLIRNLQLGIQNS